MPAATIAILQATRLPLHLGSGQGMGLDELRPVGAEALGELTRYKATLERADRKIEFPIWGEDMPDEMVALVTAKEAAKQLTNFEHLYRVAQSRRTVEIKGPRSLFS